MGTECLHKSKPVIAILLSLFLLLFYQNCSKNESFNAASTASSQCAAKKQEINLKTYAGNNQLNCSNLVNYSCEIRKFGESIKDEVIEGKTCIFVESKEVCVPTVVRHFNTSSARQIEGIDNAAFSEGGEFNRQESNCSYFDISKNMSLLRTESDSSELALKNLVARCVVAQQARDL